MNVCSWPVLSGSSGCAGLRRQVPFHHLLPCRLGLASRCRGFRDQGVFSLELTALTLLSSQGCDTSRIFSMQTPCISPSPCLFFSHFCIFHTFLRFLHVILSVERDRRNRIFPLNQNQGPLGGPSPGYPSVLSNSNAVNSPSSRRGFSRLSGLDPLMSPTADLFSSAFIVFSHFLNTA